ncbi:unnamed protein product [Calicophoron daubneyi]|uniref:Uncharacterized protein n=1 Tax=Calicophoron daubneyi TaxID=300641 RepID=A0AAV2TI28_CALDB
MGKAYSKSTFSEPVNLAGSDGTYSLKNNNGKSLRVDADAYAPVTRQTDSTSRIFRFSLGDLSRRFRRNGQFRESRKSQSKSPIVVRDRSFEAIKNLKSESSRSWSSPKNRHVAPLAVCESDGSTPTSEHSDHKSGSLITPTEKAKYPEYQKTPRLGTSPTPNYSNSSVNTGKGWTSASSRIPPVSSPIAEPTIYSTLPSIDSGVVDSPPTSREVDSQDFNSSCSGGLTGHSTPILSASYTRYSLPRVTRIRTTPYDRNNRLTSLSYCAGGPTMTAPDSVPAPVSGVLSVQPLPSKTTSIKESTEPLQDDCLHDKKNHSPYSNRSIQNSTPSPSITNRRSVADSRISESSSGFQDNLARLSSDFSLSSAYSLNSDDLMLDTDPHFSASPDYETKTRRERFFGGGHRDFTTFSKLESVTEISHDDLTKFKSSQEGADEPSPTEAPPNDGTVTTTVPSSPGSNPIPYDSSTYPKRSSALPLRRGNTTTSINSPARLSLSGLRRLRSIPGRFRFSLTYGPHGDAVSPDSDEAHSGERAFVMSASEHLQILQEIIGVKLTLLKVKRLLTEDQWHLPVFYEQLSLSEDLKDARLNMPLPREWLTARSASVAAPALHHRVRTMSEPMGEYEEGLQKTIAQDATPTITPKGDLPTPSTMSTPTSESSALAKLVENLCRLESANSLLRVRSTR